MRIRIFLVIGGFILITLGGYIIYKISPNESRFATYEDMLTSTLINNGWAPVFIPHDAYDIVEQHDLDSSEGVLEFSYKSDMWLDQVATLMREATPIIRKKWGSEAKKSGWKYRDGDMNRYLYSEESNVGHFLAINPIQKRAVYLRIIARSQ